MWRNTLWLAIVVTLVPVLILAGINFYQFDRQYKLQLNEINYQSLQLSATYRIQVSYFLEERRRPWLMSASATISPSSRSRSFWNPCSTGCANRSAGWWTWV